ncbi:hypothetical protein C4N9_07400 [Pararhodobacter marinus]|uniref:Uncharacterized protein n=1 Tax=Pararhodobacter marinus TaxID=2184063 RepID=A0A2U2CCE6_9RHOB|nr:hypothetical protein [Pararhodobacter marinus]PWE29566.1 hypothetical protein C4N9_07400 [Pararhodobacter marinus]
MTHLPKTCLVTAALFALIGMGWGIVMSASADHSLSPAHGHLNLIGFVALSIAGLYYAVSPDAARSRLGWAHYGLSVLAVIVLVPGIAMAISGQGEALAKAGSVLAILAMALFGWVVLRFGAGRSAG